MSERRGLVDGLHLLALSAWLSALISAAIAAVNVFPTLRDMPLTLGAYPQVPASDHWRYAAGEIMEGVFFLGDLVQFVAVPIVLVTLVLQHLRTPVQRPRLRIARTIVIALAAALFALHATTIAPPMNRLLRAQWAAAAEGDLAAAAHAREEFQTLHVRADGILRLNLVLILAGIALMPAATHARNGHRP